MRKLPISWPENGTSTSIPRRTNLVRSAARLRSDVTNEGHGHSASVFTTLIQMRAGALIAEDRCRARRLYWPQTAIHPAPFGAAAIKTLAPILRSAALPGGRHYDILFTVLVFAQHILAVFAGDRCRDIGVR